MQYATYHYYRETYGGEMPESEYRRYSGQAGAYLEQVTFGRVNALPEGPMMDKVRDAACALADVYKRAEQGVVSSETNGDHSITIARGSQSDAQRLYAAAALYLGNTGLLYRGVYGC